MSDVLKEIIDDLMKKIADLEEKNAHLRETDILHDKIIDDLKEKIAYLEGIIAHLRQTNILQDKIIDDLKQENAVLNQENDKFVKVIALSLKHAAMDAENKRKVLEQFPDLIANSKK